MALEMKYFVLKPRSKRANDSYANASRKAMLAYAEAIQGIDHDCDELAEDLIEWVEDEERRETRLPGVRD